MRAKPELLSRLREKSHIGQSVTFKDKASGEGKSLGTVEDEVSIILGEGSGDVYKHLIQRIKRSEKAWNGSRYEYRGGYFTLDGKKTRIVWGQYAQCLTEKEYRRLLAKARAKGWPLF
jgi:hypothetical protein